MTTKSSPKTRKLPPGWEKRIDYSSNKPYYVDHNTKTTHWHPPRPKDALPVPPPPTNLHKQPLNPSSHLAKLHLNNNKTLPMTINPNNNNQKRKRKPKHSRAGTVGSRTDFKWNMDDLQDTLQPLSDIQTSNPTPPITPYNQLRRKMSKPYSKDTIDNNHRYVYVGRRMSTKPMAPPIHLKTTPSTRNLIMIKPPPKYTKKNMAATSIPPPPPRSVATPPPKLDGILQIASPITPKHVERFTKAQRNTYTFPITDAMSPSNSNSNSNSNIWSESNEDESTPKMHFSVISKQFYRNKRKKISTKNLPSISNTPKKSNTPEAVSNTKKQTREKRTLTGPAKFGKYKNTLAKKYVKKKKSLKQKLKQKKADIKEYRKKRNSLKVSNEYVSDDNSIEYSVSTTVESSIVTNPLASQLPQLPDIKDDEKEESEEEKEEECRFFSLYEIVELVTSPQVRGTQDQTILLHTYCLYSSRQELLEVIFKRLSATSCDNQGQIKVLSLLRTWLKTENDFRDVLDDNFNQNTTDPPLTKTAAACVDLSLNIIKDDTEINKFDDKVKPQLSRKRHYRHKIEYPEDYSFELSPFAAYFRRELVSNTCCNDLLSKLAAPILSQLCMNKLDSTTNVRDRTLSFADAPTPKIPKIKDAKELNLHKMSCIEVARQICLLEYSIFKKIKAEEFLKQKSTKQKKIELEHHTMKIANTAHNLSSDQLQSQLKTLKKEKNDKLEKESMQVNIDKMTDWFNRLVVWSQVEILYERDIQKRCKIISQILKICDWLERYNNISSLCAIRAGLCSAPIHRLRKTWQNIPKKAKDIKSKIDALFKLGNGQKNLRDKINIISQPAIPHLGLFLGDIVFIHDGNETFDPLENEGNVEGDNYKNKINWCKMKLLADRINWISMFQQSPFIFQTVPIITKYLQSKMKILPQDFLYKLSREVEPPDKKK